MQSPDTNYIVHPIPLSQIMADENFNCRGAITPFDVQDLVKSIDKSGLQSPVMVTHNPAGRPYKLIAGFRRYLAFKVLKRETIPAFIRENMNEQEQLLFNLTENLKRIDLNRVQEAKAIQNLIQSGMTYNQLSARLDKPKSWVNVRAAILRLPEEIQQVIAGGLMTAKQIMTLAGFVDENGNPDYEKQCAFVREVKDRKLREEKIKDVQLVKKVQKSERRQRSIGEIQEMMDHIMDNVSVGFHTVCMGWCRGTISNQDFYLELKKFADREGLVYEIPAMEDGDASTSAQS